MANKNEDWANSLLEPAGIRISGKNPWDPKVLNPAFYDRVKAEGSIGLGESYMDGWWQCDRLDEFFYRLLLADVPSKIGFSLPLVLSVVRAKLFNLQKIARAFEVGEKHYDLGNDIFTSMLGETMAYSCGYFKNTEDLDSAQNAKFDLICRKLNLQPGEKVLDIGCGWGSFMRYAAKNYGVKVVGNTVSREQVELGKKLCEGLPVEFRLEDYRKLNEKFDKIVSVGMIEHVGEKNYRTYMEIAKKCLKEDGLFLLHTIGKLDSSSKTEPWLNKYIFPNGMLPSLRKLTKAVEGLFVIEDIHNFSADYDKTLMAWHNNFEASWPELKNKYDERFHRMWNYYILCCAGAFRARTIQLWQIVLSPKGVPGGYKSIR